MKTIICVALAALATMAAMPGAAQDYPKLKSGLWELNRTSNRGPNQPNAMTMCLDESVQKEMFDIGAGAMKGMCSKHEFRMSGSRGIGESVCDFGGSTMRSKMEMVMNGDTGYRTEIHTTYDPPFMGQTDGTTVVTARLLGACKPGQRPGDMTMPNGQTMNVRDMMGRSKSGPPARAKSDR